MSDCLQDIISYEEGHLNDEEVIKLFQDLIDDGIVWQLQGHYGRLANLLLESGFCDLPGRKGA